MIRTERPHLEVGTFTHPGLSGKINEDRFAVEAFQGASGRPVLFAVIADGIGGHLAGEIAAELTVNCIVQDVAGSDGAEPLRVMEAAIQAASEQISERAARASEEAGMGSTCACAWIEGDRLYTAYVGDSRIYLVRDGVIRRTSVDHTWIQEAIDRGLISSDEAHHHPNAHVLRRHLGAHEPPDIDSRLSLANHEEDDRARQNQGLRLKPSDLVLLCTDGLTDMVREDEIRRLVTERRTLKSAAKALVDRANVRGGRDNITVVLLRARPEAVRSNQVWRRLRRPEHG